MDEERASVLSDDERMSLDMACSATGRKLTEEQMIFASDFTKPTISFSDAGTGKTYATAVGLVHTQTYHKVPGNKICVLSFTREAARVIKQRYDLMTKYTFGIKEAEFSTFHSLCNSIISSAWGRPNIQKGHDWVEDVNYMHIICKRYGLDDITDTTCRQIISAIDSMNANFVFDKNNLEQMLRFKQLKMDATLFNEIRVDWFLMQATGKKIPQGDIPIHCYYLLKRNKTIRKMYSKMFDVLIVDEFQDMSVLYLKILYEVSKSITVIGDMKQQIYAFNGASDSIVKEFMHMYPDARVCSLTHSFRCKNELLDAAMKLERPNLIAEQEYEGVGTGGIVEVKSSRQFDFNQLCNDIAHMQQNKETVEQRDIMFLARNNLSVMSIIDKLYSLNVQFRTSKFKRVMDIPIFEEMCILLDAIEDDTDVNKVGNALRLFKEFRYRKSDNQIPLLSIIRNTGKGWLSINYDYKSARWTALIKLFNNLKEALAKEVPCTNIFNTLMPIYESYIIEGQWWKLEFEKEFYINLVAPIIGKKSYQRMRAEENDKLSINNTNMTLYTGVRCYTIHSAKGLEADEVYVLDCDNGVIPSAANMKKYLNAKCYYEAAKVIRNERNLLYVAVTRARNKAVLLYNSELSELIKSPLENSFSYLDEIYNSNVDEYYNDETFMALFNYSKEDVSD